MASARLIAELATASAAAIAITTGVLNMATSRFVQRPASIGKVLKRRLKNRRIDLRQMAAAAMRVLDGTF
jgi:hypothetical protein